MSRAEPRPLICVHRPDQGFWLCQQRGPCLLATAVHTRSSRSSHCSLMAWLDRCFPMPISEIPLTFPIGWNRAGYWHQSCSSFLQLCSQASSGGFEGTYIRKPQWWLHIWLMKTDWQKCSLLTTCSWLASQLAYKSCSISTLMPQSSSGSVSVWGKTEVLF